MLCFNCEESNFETKDVRIQQELKGDTISVVTEAEVCSACGFEHLTDDQANLLRKNTADEYKRIHGLLTSEEIKLYRNKLGMSQRQFAEYLGFGEASVKRWETYFIQDKSADKMIRIQCDPFEAQNNALEVKWAQEEESEYNGYQKFRVEIFSNVVSKILEVAPSPLFFYKVLFFIDFDHFQNYGKSITGMQYSCLEKGPIPKGYDILVDYLLSKKFIAKKSGHDLVGEIEFNKNLFTTDELATINRYYNLAKKYGKDYLLKKSHDEEVYKSTDYLERLSYYSAPKLKTR